MDLNRKLLADMKDALKAHDEVKLGTLRLINSEIKYKKIDLHRDPNDEEILAILINQIKKRKESIALYNQGGRAELAAKEEKELAVLATYLPQQVSEDELRNRIAAVIKETGAQGQKDFGKIMKIVTQEFKGRADGNIIKNLVGERLGN